MVIACTGQIASPSLQAMQRSSPAHNAAVFILWNRGDGGPFHGMVNRYAAETYS